jgi:hypothetical protein
VRHGTVAWGVRPGLLTRSRTVIRRATVNRYVCEEIPPASNATTRQRVDGVAIALDR